MVDQKPRRARGTGGIRKRADGRVEGTLDLGRGPDGRRRRVSVFGRTDAEARRKLAAAQRAYAQGTLTAPSRLTVEAFLREWLADVVSGLAPATQRRYRGAVETHAYPAFGTVRLTALTPLHLQRRYGAMLQAGSSPNTIRKTHQIFAAAFQYAEDLDLLPRNPARRARPPRGVPTDRRPLTPADARRVLVTARGDPWEALWWLLLTTGARLGEMLALAWADVDLAAGTLTIRRSKTRAGVRVVQLAPEACQALGQHRQGQAAERSLWVFPYAQTGGPTTRQDHVRAAWYALLTRAGVGRVVVHGCRHTAATLWRDLGIPLETVKGLLGHSRITVTADIYTAASPELQREAVTRLGALLATEGDAR